MVTASVGKRSDGSTAIEKVSGRLAIRETYAPRAGLGESPPSPLPQRGSLRIDTTSQGPRRRPGRAHGPDLPNILVGRRMFDMPPWRGERVPILRREGRRGRRPRPRHRGRSSGAHRRRVRGSPRRLRSGRGDQGRAPSCTRTRGVRRSPARATSPNVQSVLRFKLGTWSWVPSGRPGLRAHFRTQLDHRLSRASAGVVGIDEDGRVQVWASTRCPSASRSSCRRRYSFRPPQIDQT